MFRPFQQRRDQLFDCLAARGIETAMVNTPTHIQYLTGVKINPYERFVALFLNCHNRQCYLILPSLEKGLSCDNSIAKVVYGDDEDSTDKLLDLVERSDALGVEKDRLAFSLGEKILAHTPPKASPKRFRFEDIGRLIWDLRLCKGPKEIETIQTAVGHRDDILEKVRRTICIGRSEKDISFGILQEMSTRPGVSANTFVAQVLSGPNSSRPHGTAGDRKLQKGDPITIDFGVYYDCYWSDITRTFFLGPPDPSFEKIYKVVLAAQQAAIDTVRPGIMIRDIDLAARRAIEKAGYGELFIHRTGHGIGLDIHEFPSIHSNNSQVLKENMVFTIEPGIYLPELGGVRIEDDVTVTRQGAQVMNRYPKGYEDMILPVGV